jgi:hypothetical protein
MGDGGDYQLQGSRRCDSGEPEAGQDGKDHQRRHQQPWTPGTRTGMVLAGQSNRLIDVQYPAILAPFTRGYLDLHQGGATFVAAYSAAIA